MIEINDVPILASVEDIVSTLRMELHAHGVPLLKDMKKTQNNVMVTCPVHKNGQEQQPSCGISVVNIRRNNKTYPAGTVNCFRCGYIASLPEMISYCFGFDDKGRQGFKWVTKNFVNIAIEERPDMILDMSRGKKKKEERQYLSEEELDAYRYTHPYMYQRGLTDDIIEEFDIGYDKEYKALTFPVHDETGKTLFVQRRSVKGKQFINDITTMKSESLYGYYHVIQNLHWIDRLYICESPIDALTFWKYDMAAVATMQAIPTPTQLKLLDRLPIREQVSALDDDEAGRKGEERLKKHLGKSKLLYDVKFPSSGSDEDKMDINKMDQAGYDLRSIGIRLL